MMDSDEVGCARDEVREAPRPHIVEGRSGDMPAYLRKAMSDSIKADMDDPARAGACIWLGDRDAAGSPPQTGV